uniref:Protein kinase putative n=2 Tax=Albugo laibachii Nc14 TaxID=890382 RepID=F0WWH3_9STRA|nr:protein kinase putative [Albugo laibachii Nc14]|eukprot:CCA25796.1 protein kinase putative [Albugo laibachii Nc14]
MIKKALEEWRRQKERQNTQMAPKKDSSIPPQSDAISNEDEVVKLKQMLKNKEEMLLKYEKWFRTLKEGAKAKQRNHRNGNPTNRHDNVPAPELLGSRNSFTPSHFGETEPAPTQSDAATVTHAKPPPHPIAAVRLHAYWLHLINARLLALTPNWSFINTSTRRNAPLSLSLPSFHSYVAFVCLEWGNVTCNFHKPNKINLEHLNLTTQTMCKAEVAAAVKQIDWASPLGGKGSVKLLAINRKNLLPEPVYPMEAYTRINYPHCDDMYTLFPPYGNGVIGADGRRSIMDLIDTNSIIVDIQVAWEGPHEKQPVCSLAGISYAGYLQVEIYIEAQENSGGYKSRVLDGICHPHRCVTETVFVIVPPTMLLCVCVVASYATPECKDCASDYYGKHCIHKCDPCLNDGHCDSGESGAGSCICKTGFDPATRCATCLAGYYGEKCSKCPECNFPHGSCDDGLTGSGRCSCAVGFDAEQHCMQCLDNFYGSNCEPCQPCHVGKCNHGLTGNGDCTCPEGFSSMTRCTECLSNYYGGSCTPCRTCNNHGRCNNTIVGDGSCICDEGYKPLSRCSLCAEGWDFNPETMACQCAPQHFGSHCLSCPICAPHGHCNSGKEGDGRCICDIGWSDSNNCVGCMSGYFGEDCRLCRKCGAGHCDDGMHGTGRCNCKRGWDSSTDCFDCVDGFFGPKCLECPQDCGHGVCSSGKNGTGQCICNDGWNIDATPPCTTCLYGYLGPQCQLCPGFLESDMPCNGHGNCYILNDQAVCQCDARYTGSGCEIYDFPLMMVMILGTIALTTLGFCMCTMRRLARQPRNHRRPFPHHQSSSFSRSEYVEIAGMSDLEYFVSNDSRDWLVPFESLTLQSEVGNGTSGQVFKSLLHCGGGSSVVAVKRLYSPVTGQEYFQSFFRREVGILSRLHHPNVVRFYGVSYYNRVLYIVTDFCPKSLNHLIEDPTARGQIEKSFFMKIITQVVSGMGFLHSRSVVHRDLKPANVLISDRNDVNICDFGLSRLIDPEMTSMTAEVGTPSYMAPEMATMGGIQCSTKGDVYSFGILLYTTWSRSKPYGDQGMNPFQLMAAVVNGLRPVIPINCPPGLARLMRACWDMKSEKRPTFPEISLILKDEWLLASGTEEFPFDGEVERNLCNISTTSSATTTTAVFRQCSNDSESPSHVNLRHRMSEVEEESAPLLAFNDEGLS